MKMKCKHLSDSRKNFIYYIVIAMNLLFTVHNILYIILLFYVLTF